MDNEDNLEEQYKELLKQNEKLITFLVKEVESLKTEVVSVQENVDSLIELVSFIDDEISSTNDNLDSIIERVNSFHNTLMAYGIFINKKVRKEK